MSNAPDVPCIDCGAPDGTPYLNGRCRDCDIDWVAEGLRCKECREMTNVNGMALMILGWHGYHLPTCSHYLPNPPPAQGDEGRDDDRDEPMGGDG